MAFGWYWRSAANGAMPRRRSGFLMQGGASNFRINQKTLLRRLRTLLQSSSLRWNFVGNVTGRLWLGVMNLVAVPVFVHLLGTNAFGIVSLVQPFNRSWRCLISGWLARPTAKSRCRAPPGTGPHCGHRQDIRIHILDGRGDDRAWLLGAVELDRHLVGAKANAAARRDPAGRHFGWHRSRRALAGGALHRNPSGTGAAIASKTESWWSPRPPESG